MRGRTQQPRREGGTAKGWDEQQRGDEHGQEWADLRTGVRFGAGPMLTLQRWMLQRHTTPSPRLESFTSRICSSHPARVQPGPRAAKQPHLPHPRDGPGQSSPTAVMNAKMSTEPAIPTHPVYLSHSHPSLPSFFPSPSFLLPPLLPRSGHIPDENQFGID